MRLIQKRFFVVSLCLAEVLLILNLSAPTVRAEVKKSGTHVSGDIAFDAVWDVQGSPYIFDYDVNVLTSATLRIMPGVRIVLSPLNTYASLVIHGKLDVAGLSENPIDISGINIYSDGNISISYAKLHDGPTIRLFNSRATIASSSILSGNGSAFYMLGSSLEGWNLRIENSSAYGIYVVGWGNQAFLPGVSIHNSSFIGNATAVSNKVGIDMYLENNWWGDVVGPVFSGTNSIKGSISYDPWLTSDPAPAGVCCSSILFIPGLEGTRLYSGTDRLWEPNINSDVTELYLDENGASKQPDVFSTGPIDKALGLKPIYDNFLEFLDELVKNGSMNEARSFGYDWRKPIDEVVMGRERKAATSESLLDVVAGMASTSKTGKVTLVAHSNGGLVVKYLIKTLEDKGELDLIDKIISVAVPYLGTPEGLIGLLHGDHQSILGGLIMSSAVARGLGENMPSAYSLLPTAAYFANVFNPTIAFAATTVKGLNDGSYPVEVKSAAGQSDFILDKNKVRMKPSFTDVSIPLIGNAKLLHTAEILRGLLDVYEWPASIMRWAIVGWNFDTTTGIKYSSRQSCNGILAMFWCRGSNVIHRILTSVMGDGTVIVNSAAYDSGQVVSLDLAKVSAEEGTKIDHVNILESSTTRGIMKELVTSNSISNENMSNLAGVSFGEPDYSKEPTFLVVSAHSRVELHVYDSKGRHTGLIPKPASLANNDFIVGAYETEIPGSHFEIENAEDNPDTYVKLPTSGGEKYSISIRGKDFGFFTFGVEQAKGGQSLSETEYEMEPSSPIMVATTTIVSDMPVELYSPKYPGAPILHVDVNGDGSTDYESLPGGNGLPGNATTTEDADRIAREQSVDVLKKTDVEPFRNDPRRLEFIKKVYPDSKDGRPTTSPLQTTEQKAPPVSGGANCVQSLGDSI